MVDEEVSSSGLTYFGVVNTPVEAHAVLEASKQGLLPRVTRRLTDDERAKFVRPGAVFVWEEEEAGIRRWTDHVKWSPSRVSGAFLTYSEVPSRGDDTLIKQSFSSLDPQGVKLHLIAYMSKAAHASGELPIASHDPLLQHLIAKRTARQGTGSPYTPPVQPLPTADPTRPVCGRSTSTSYSTTKPAQHTAPPYPSRHLPTAPSTSSGVDHHRRAQSLTVEPRPRPDTAPDFRPSTSASDQSYSAPSYASLRSDFPSPPPHFDPSGSYASTTLSSSSFSSASSSSSTSARPWPFAYTIPPTDLDLDDPSQLSHPSRPSSAYFSTSHTAAPHHQQPHLMYSIHSPPPSRPTTATAPPPLPLRSGGSLDASPPSFIDPFYRQLPPLNALASGMPMSDASPGSRYSPLHGTFLDEEGDDEASGERGRGDEDERQLRLLNRML